MRVLMLGLLLAIIGMVASNKKTYFSAGALSHRVILPPVTDEAVSRQEALKTIMKNLEIYKQEAMSAKEKQVDILVFPEHGLFGWDFDRVTVQPFLEHVPDFKRERWNPCQNPHQHSDSVIQHHLSCMAKNNSLYVVANLGSIVQCDEESTEEGGCPEGGHYQYNTAVVFDKTGELVATYNKRSLNEEPQYDAAQEAEMVSFTTPFGTFGLYMCEEINHYDPAMRMIDELGIANIVCPMSWRDIPPNQVAIQVLSGFAKGFGVNIIAANIHRPDFGIHGSGIFSPDGAVQFSYDNRLNSNGRLITGLVGVLRRRQMRQRIPQYDPTMKDDIKDEDTFMAPVNGDDYKFVALDDTRNSFKLCADEVCCDLEYTMERRGQDLYAFGVFSGHHTEPNNKYLYFQSCLILRCANSSRESCGQPTTVANSAFTHLRINAYFSTKYVIPQYIISNRGQLYMATSQWHYQDGVLWSKQRSYPMISAGFYGRIYSRDTSSSQTIFASCVLLVWCVVLNLFIG